MLAADRTSRLYDDGARRSLFYAQSWAMVHLLLTGEPKRTEQLAAYVRLTARGTPSIGAWRQTFGTFDVHRELREHLGRPILPSYVHRSARKSVFVEPHVSRPKPADTEAVLAWLLRYGTPQAVEPRLRSAVAMSPPSMLARALLGRLLSDAKRHEEAGALLMQRERRDVAGPRAQLERLKSVPFEERRVNDPWWIYYTCNGRHAEAEIGELRRLFSTPEGR